MQETYVEDEGIGGAEVLSQRVVDVREDGMWEVHHHLATGQITIG